MMSSCCSICPLPANTRWNTAGSPSVDSCQDDHQHTLHGSDMAFHRSNETMEHWWEAISRETMEIKVEFVVLCRAKISLLREGLERDRGDNRTLSGLMYLYII